MTGERIRVRTMRRMEYTIPSPTTAETFGEAFALLEKRFRALVPEQDPTGKIYVRSTSSDITLYFDVEVPFVGQSVTVTASPDRIMLR